MIRNQSRYYQESGAVPLGGVIWALAVFAPAMILLTLVYAALCRYATIDKLKVLVMMLFTGLVFAIALALKTRAKIRNRWFAAGMGLAMGLFALYWAWVWYPCAMSNWDADSLYFWPPTQWEVLHELANQPGGLWIKGGKPVSVMELYFAWGLEAVGLVVAAIAAGIQHQPFCEACARWTMKPPFLLTTGMTDLDQLQEELEAEKYGLLDRLPPVPPGPQVKQPIEVLNWSLDSCPGCQKMVYLSVTKVKKQVNAKGVHSESGKPVFKWLQITPEVVQTLADY